MDREEPADNSVLSAQPALIVVSHTTSVRKGIEAMDDLTVALRVLLPRMRVECAYLSGEPGLEDQLSALIRAGHTHIMIFPYFLHAGVHVLQELPDRLTRFTPALPPAVRVDTLPHLGSHEWIPRLIAASAQARAHEAHPRKPNLA